jgi:hypoxanthine phosphoribosyltransferase
VTAAQPDPHRPARPAFAHASEAEMARILDFYEVRWAYEPDTFPIGWTLEGEVVESFSPDFYLPDLELYLELTTLKQSLVRKKNRKLRRLRELYPDVRIKLFYARDFRALLLKFGRLALADELSGTIGQSTPPRVPAVATAAVVVETAEAAAEAAANEPEASASAPAGPDALDPLAAAVEHGRPPRPRRRGRRRRAQARAAALAATADPFRAGAGPYPAGVTARVATTVASPGRYPA